jgi:hypothetical protein
LTAGGWLVAPVGCVTVAGGAAVETEVSDCGPRAGRAASPVCASRNAGEASALFSKPQADAAPADTASNASVPARPAVVFIRMIALLTPADCRSAGV